MGACFSAILRLFQPNEGYIEVKDAPDVELGTSTARTAQVPMTQGSSNFAVPDRTAHDSSEDNASTSAKTSWMAMPRSANSSEPLGSDFHRKYALKREIGSGSTSKVFDCIRRKDNKTFACKVINKAEIETYFSGLMDQFTLEIKVLKILNHPNIIKMVDAFETDDSVYMVLEQCNGGELFDHVVEKGTLSEEEASTIIRNITSAVRHMHSLDIIHRDLKPENLLLTSTAPDAEVKLIDFGLAKIMQDDVARSFLGTKGYLAPEMLKRDAYDKSVDMWALGVIAFVLLCGCLPFDDDGSRIHSESAARRKFTLRFPRWSANLSNSAKDLLYNLLDVDPKNRFTADQALSHPWVRGQTVQPNNYLESPSLIGRTRKDARAKEAAALALSPQKGNSRLAQIKEESRAMNPRGNTSGIRQGLTRADSM